MDTTPNDIVTRLSPEEALVQLASESLGRLAIAVGGKPEIFPVNYVVGDGKVLFRTAPGAKLLGLTVNSHVAFQSDSHTTGEAWSVVVKGTARALESEAEIAAADALELRPWVPTLKYVYVEITPVEITGFRFRLGPEPERITGA